ncbi:MAG TPA: hypothetical protein DCE78_06960 [Bacteroidetes bacterium]|nr:hypothetical protein [Bacteroidota bacterium]
MTEITTSALFNYQACGISISSEIELPELALKDVSAPLDTIAPDASDATKDSGTTDVSQASDTSGDSYDSKGSVTSEVVKTPPLSKDSTGSSKIYTTNPDEITVTLGDTRVEFEKPPTTVKPFSRYNAAEYNFELPDVIRLLVRNGNEIILEILTQDLNYALQYVYQNAIPIAMIQRGMILFRASGIIDGSGQVWLFFAPPRSGKTATALMLMERGYRFFADNLMALTMVDQQIMASSFSPTIHLWKQVLDEQKTFNAQDVSIIRASIPKYSVRYTDKFIASPQKVKRLIEVEHLSSAISSNKIKPIQAFETLRNAVYLNHLTSEMGREPQIFSMLSKLANQSELYRVFRPKSGDSYRELAEFIDTKLIKSGTHD